MSPNDQKSDREQMIRRRLTSTKPAADASETPRRRRLSGIPYPSPPSDERDLLTDDLEAKLRLSYLAEQARIRDAILRETGGDVLSIVRESLGNMSSRDRRRVQSLLGRRLGVR